MPNAYSTKILTLLGAPVKGLSLNSGDSGIELQFADGSTLLVDLDEQNSIYLSKRVDVYCIAFGSKIALHKSSVLSWLNEFPNRLLNIGWKHLGN